MKQWKIYAHILREKCGKKGETSRNLYVCKTMKNLYAHLEEKKAEKRREKYKFVHLWNYGIFIRAFREEKSGNLYICETMGKKEKRTCKFKRTPVKQWKKGKTENLYTHRWSNGNIIRTFGRRKRKNKWKKGEKGRNSFHY